MHQIDFNTLSSKLDKPTISTDILLGRVKLLDSSSRDTAAFNDNRYLPFYYHLGKEIDQSVKVIQIGAKLGLIGACFMQGCKHAVDWWAIEEEVLETSIPKNIIKSNLKMFCQGQSDLFVPWNSMDISLMSIEVNYEIAFLSESYNSELMKKYLEILWDHLISGGLLVVDYIQNEANMEIFKGFCRVKNREPHILDTRYGVGILIR